MEETGIATKLEEISKKLDKLINSLDNQPEEKTDLVATALAAAQSEYKPLYFNKNNNYFMTPFTTLSAIFAATRPALNKNGLAFTQKLMSQEDNSLTLNSEVVHSSGQKFSSVVRVVAQNDHQARESAINQCKGNVALALLGIAAEDDALDDNGERAAADSREIFAKGTALNRNYNPKETSGLTITKEQLEELEYILSPHMDVAEQLMDALKIQSLSSLPKDKYMMAIKRSHEIINAREGLKQNNK